MSQTDLYLFNFLIIIQIQETKQLVFNHLLFDQTITSDVIEALVGSELQDKLFDIPL